MYRRGENNERFGVLQIDSRRKHVSLLNPEGHGEACKENGQQKRQAPMLFAFDAIFPEESTEVSFSLGGNEF